MEIKNIEINEEKYPVPYLLNNGDYIYVDRETLKPVSLSNFNLNILDNPILSRARRDLHAEFSEFLDLDSLVPFDKDGKVGLMRFSGEIVVPSVFEYVKRLKNGSFSGKLNGKHAILDSKGHFLTDFEYDHVEEYCSYGYGIDKSFVFVANGFLDKKWAVVNIDTKAVSKCIYSVKQYMSGINDDGSHWSHWTERPGMECENIVCLKKEEKWGFLNAYCIEITDFVYDIPTAFINGLAYVLKKNKFGVIDKNGTEIIPCKFNEIERFGTDSFRVLSTIIIENRFIEVVNGKKLTKPFYREVTTQKWGVIDVNGNVIIEPRYERIKHTSEKGEWYVRSNNKYGVINYLGEEIVPCIYDSCISSANSFFVFQNEERAWACINKVTGKQSISFVLQGVDVEPRFAMVKAWMNGKCGLIDSNGQIMVDFIYNDIFLRGVYDESLNLEDIVVIVEQNEKWGVLNKESGESSICKYHGIENYIDDLLVARLFGRYRIIDRFNNEISPISFESVYALKKGLIAIKLNGNWGVIDKQGNEVIEPIYEEFGLFSLLCNNYLEAKLHGKWGVIDLQGNAVVKFEYDGIYCDMDCFICMLNDKFGLLDKNGIQLTGFIYDDKFGFYQNNSGVVKKDGRFGLLGKDGCEILPCIYDKIGMLEKNIAAVKNDGEYFYVDSLGNEYRKK